MKSHPEIAISRFLLIKACAAFVLIPGSWASAQQFINVASSNLPASSLNTEAARFADIDLDGDLDILYANGGAAGSQQSKVYINSGLAQGGTLGVYTDGTAAAIPTLFNQASNDIQAIDMDRDGDLDLCISNHSNLGNQSNTIYINQGGAQGGTTGVFVLSMSRYYNIGSAGSSIPAAQKITTGNFAGGFVDWSGQCDFADVDLDGDFDLLHTSFGSAFSGNVMTRLFLNGYNGAPAGFFNEYNPSAVVSANPNLASGSQAGWAEGSQQSNTTDTLGLNHDITNTSLDADFADLDGDFDNDIQASSRATQNRMYQNRFNEYGGLGAGNQRLYRDLTNSWMLGANGLPQSGQNYDSDLQDVDLDNDVDAYFLNYTGAFQDRVSLNDGTGKQTTWYVVPNSTNDDNEIDWIDFDHDGDVDSVISAFSGADRFYQNNMVENGVFSFDEVTISDVASAKSLAADVGDMDNDGDADMIFAQDGVATQVLLRNELNVPDPVAPRVPHIQQLPNGAATSAQRRIIARAFDNINLEYFSNSTATLDFTVNGEPHSTPALYAGGNLFRATMPGYWCGNIQYSLRIQDRAGNTGVSPIKNFTVAQSGFTTFGAAVNGCNGNITLSVNSCPTIHNPEFIMRATGAPPSTLQLCIVSDVQGTGIDELGIGIPAWAGIVGATEIFLLDAVTDGSGLASAPATIPDNPLLIGANYYFQFIFADFGCGAVLSTSEGGKLTIQP